MTKEELQSFIKQFPDKVSFYNGVNWFTKPIKRRPWYKMKDVTNIFEIMPDEAIEDDHLVIKYDNAYNCMLCQTPSIEDYKQILNTCNKIDVEGDCGVLLSKEGKYLYLAEGKYWTSSFKRDQVGKIHPIHIIVSHGKIEYSTRHGVNALLNIIPIEKTENQFDVIDQFK